MPEIECRCDLSAMFCVLQKAIGNLPAGEFRKETPVRREIDREEIVSTRRIPIATDYQFDNSDFEEGVFAVFHEEKESRRQLADNLCVILNVLPIFLEEVEAMFEGRSVLFKEKSALSFNPKEPLGG